MVRFMNIVVAVSLPISVPAVIYNQEDYVEIDQIPSSPQEESGVDWAEIARSVAVVYEQPEPGVIDFSNESAFKDGSFDPPLDPDFEFADQVELDSDGTASLISEDQVMTAGHLGNKTWFENNAVFLFDYKWNTTLNKLDKTTWQEDEIYRCKEVQLHRNDDQGDYSICLLDKPVKDRVPVQLLPVDSPSTLNFRPARMISAPDGLPVKMTEQGRLWDKNLSENCTKFDDLDPSKFFYHNLDNSEGSSGAPIFLEETGQMVGTQSKGDKNWIEEGTYTEPVVGNLRASNLESESFRGLCGEIGSVIPVEALMLIGEI